MKSGLTIYGFALALGPAIAFCETREAALSGAHVHRAELLADGGMAGGEHPAGLPPTPIYKIVLRPIDSTMVLNLLNNPETHVARMLESVETIAFVSAADIALRSNNDCRTSAASNPSPI